MMKYSIFKRLSNQAAGSVPNDFRGCDWQREYDKIFAELIIKECVGVVEKRFMGDLNREDMEVRRCAKDLKKHFGVE
jgi:hypothetical protein